MILTEEEIKEWNVPRERLNEKYLNTLTKQILPYDEIVEMVYIDGSWETEWNFASPVEEVDRRIKIGFYILVEDKKAVVK